MSAGFLWGAAAAPDRIALCWRDRQVSYQELHWHVARASATPVPSAEASSVLGLETAVGFAPEPTLPHLVCLLAHAEQGVPCVLLHPRWPAPERQRALAELPPITLRQPSPTLEHSLLRADVSPASVGFARATFSEERALAVLFTSGSSSGAKAVVLSRRAFHAAANASAERLGWQSDDRWLLSLPLAHVGGLSVLIRCLTAGQTVVLPDPEVALTTESLARCIAEEAPTLLSLVPTQLSRLLGLSGWNLPRSVRAVLVGGASCPPALVQEAMQRGWPLRRTYGMTETCAQVATAHQDQAPGAALPLVAGVEARIQGGVIQLKARSLLSAYVRTARSVQHSTLRAGSRRAIAAL